MSNPDPLIVTHNPEARRFELEAEGALSVLAYLLEPGRIVFTHTEVPPALEGRGLGSRLARAGLDYARANSLRVASTCSFMDHYLRKHPEYQDLL
ncbi:MAG TPA: GNAT family N-acetyltransferase [Anaerolineales bacterium]|nr:GNAT family N-acetyltransferase [Anaerolineales bacterium]